MAQELTASERRRGWWLVGLFVALVVGSWVFPHTPMSGTIWCPFRRLTGFLCPGCGMTRACVSLVRGAVGESLGHHAFGVGLVFGLGVSAGQHFVQIVRGRRVDWWGMRLWLRHERVFWRVLLVMLLVYSAARYWA